jgi:hypothetical protein
VARPDRRPLRLSARAFAVAVVVAIVTLAGHRPAWPCGNAVNLTKEQIAKIVARAERVLDEDDDPSDARRIVRPLLDPRARRPGPLTADGKPIEPALLRRAKIVFATTSVRLGLERKAARATLEALAKDDPEHPLLRARVAEAMSHGDDEDREAARETLEDLAQRDLVPDARAWGALARLRHAAGKATEAEDARARCRKLTFRKRTCALRNQ